MNTTDFSFVANSLADTDLLGLEIGKGLSAGSTLGLSGTLGAGKTRLTQAIGRGLGIADAQIVSPTFTLMVPHTGRLTMLHLDAYRIGSATEVDELGLDEMVADGAVLIVEWAERIENLLPPLDLHIKIDHVGDQARCFALTSSSDAGADLVRHLAATCPAA